MNCKHTGPFNCSTLHRTKESLVCEHEGIRSLSRASRSAGHAPHVPVNNAVLFRSAGISSASDFNDARDVICTCLPCVLEICRRRGWIITPAVFFAARFCSNFARLTLVNKSGVARSFGNSDVKVKTWELRIVCFILWAYVAFINEFWWAILVDFRVGLNILNAVICW